MQVSRKALRGLLSSKDVLARAVEGEYLFVWATEVAGGEVWFRITHVSLLYRRPWRPTFLHTEAANTEAAAVLDRYLHMLICGRMDLGVDPYITLKPKATDKSLPMFASHAEFALELAEQGAQVFHLGTLTLSSRMTPFPGSRGLVRAMLSQHFVVCDISQKQKQGACKRGDAARSQPSRHHDVNVADAGGSGQPITRHQDPTSSEDGSQASVKEDDADELGDELVHLWDEVVEPKPPQRSRHQARAPAQTREVTIQIRRQRK